MPQNTAANPEIGTSKAPNEIKSQGKKKKKTMQFI